MSNRIGDYDKYKYPRLCCKSNEGSNNYASYYRVSRKGHYWKLKNGAEKTIMFIGHASHLMKKNCGVTD